MFEKQPLAGVSNDKIIAITGHKTEQSIKAYMDTDLEDHHHHISTLLSNQKPLMEKPMSATVQPWHVPHAVHHRPILKSVTCVLYSLAGNEK